MAVETFMKYLEENSIDIDIIVTQESTHSAIEAASTHNVPVSNIVKSLLVKVSDSFKLYLVPGNIRLDLDGIKKEFGTDDVRMANAKEVKEVTGYSIGGVPPFGHTTRLDTVIVDGFDIKSEIVAAAGSSNSVFKCTLELLKKYIYEI